MKKVVPKPKLKPRPKVARKVEPEELEPTSGKYDDKILNLIDASYGKKSARDRFREQLSFVLNEPKGKQAYTEVPAEEVIAEEPAAPEQAVAPRP